MEQIKIEAQNHLLSRHFNKIGYVVYTSSINFAKLSLSFVKLSVIAISCYAEVRQEAQSYAEKRMREIE